MTTSFSKQPSSSNINSIQIAKNGARLKVIPTEPPVATTAEKPAPTTRPKSRSLKSSSAPTLFATEEQLKAEERRQRAERLKLARQQSNRISLATVHIGKLKSKLTTDDAVIDIWRFIISWMLTWRDRQRFLKMRQSAISIQRYFRGYKQRKQYRKQREALIRVQANIRRQLVQKRYNISQMKKAAVTIQSLVRMCRERKKFQELRRKFVTGQKMIRGYLTRRRYERTILKPAFEKAQIALLEVYAAKFWPYHLRAEFFLKTFDTSLGNLKLIKGEIQRMNSLDEDTQAMLSAKGLKKQIGGIIDLIRQRKDSMSKYFDKWGIPADGKQKKKTLMSMLYTSPATVENAYHSSETIAFICCIKVKCATPPPPMPLISAKK